MNWLYRLREWLFGVSVETLSEEEAQRRIVPVHTGTVERVSVERRG